ncbi:hypothetical protein [Thermofilum pendens]|uniref:Class III signal peptide-containing protein n=1 Tax=Thermofilum pendens (strain DSM 2475 / Hrk 5) TaxID=368408 RepID=A1RXZ9_THEPD|nr:hypothetical protein [Thermofilum pendens]ABL78079.1 hypothetical protein Tpen_0677 [Thermofilum pendens Hrk 5]
MELEEAVLSVLLLSASFLIYTYWLQLANTWSGDAASLIRDVCAVSLSPPGTSMEGVYDVDVCVSGNVIATRYPVYSYCFPRINETAIKAPVKSDERCFSGRIRLKITKAGNVVTLERG